MVSRGKVPKVFRVVAPILGDLAIGLTDGEFGLRRFWVFYTKPWCEGFWWIGVLMD